MFFWQFSMYGISRSYARERIMTRQEEHTLDPHNWDEFRHEKVIELGNSLAEAQR